MVAKTAPDEYHFVMLAWGESYLSLMLDVCLPNHLTPGNLGVFAHTGGARFFLYTSPEDRTMVEAHPVWRRLTTLMEVTLITVQGLHRSPQRQTGEDYIDVLAAMTRCHRMAIERAAKSDTALIFLAPDTVMSEGSLAAVMRRAQDGVRVVCIPQMRVASETFVPAFKHSFGADDGKAAAERLVALALKHLHPLTRNFFVDSPTFPTIPWALFWPVGDKGLVGHCAGFHPLMIRPRNRLATPFHSIDEDYCLAAVPNIADYSMPATSAEMVAFEMSPSHKLPALSQPGRFSQSRFADGMWRHLFTNKAAHRIRSRMFLRPTRIDGGSVTRDEWKPAEEKAMTTARHILGMAGLMGKIRNRKSPLWLNRVERVALIGSGRGTALAETTLRWRGLQVVHRLNRVEDLEQIDSGAYDFLFLHHPPNHAFGYLARRGVRRGDGYALTTDTIAIGREEGVLTSCATTCAEPAIQGGIPVRLRAEGKNLAKGNLRSLTNAEAIIDIMAPSPLLLPGMSVVLLFESLNLCGAIRRIEGATPPRVTIQLQPIPSSHTTDVTKIIKTLFPEETSAVEPSHKHELLPPHLARSATTLFTPEEWESWSKERKRLPHPLSPHRRRAVIFGVGSAGKAARAFARKLGLTILFFVDNNQETWGATRFGYPVYDPVSLKKEDHDLILVAAGGEGADAIFHQLVSYGFTYGDDFYHFRDRFSLPDADGGISIIALEPQSRSLQTETIPVTGEWEGGNSFTGELRDIGATRLRLHLITGASKTPLPGGRATLSLLSPTCHFDASLFSLDGGADANNTNEIITTFVMAPLPEPVMAALENRLYQPLGGSATPGV